MLEDSADFTIGRILEAKACTFRRWEEEKNAACAETTHGPTIMAIATRGSIVVVPERPT
jgi:hypothetical protein